MVRTRMPTVSTRGVLIRHHESCWTPITRGARFVVETTPVTFRTPAITIYSHDVLQSVRFYARLGFQERFRTPDEGSPVHVEVTLAGYMIGFASIDAAIAVHGLRPDLRGRPVELVLWTEDTDRDYARLTTGGAPSRSPPHDFLAHLRAAWVADPDGTPLQLVQHR
jgi:hypothetical protein